MKHKKAIAALLAVALVGAAGCAQQSAPPSTAAGTYQTITAQQAQQMMEQDESLIVLDVRTAQEYEQAHIEGAMLLPDGEIEQRAAQQLPDLDATILVYCRSGRRSAAAARQLADLGYTQVYDFGGIIDWPYATVSGPAEP